MAARYLTRKQEVELTKQIRNFNKRLNELARQKRFQGVILPLKLDVKTELNAIHSYNDLRVLKGRMERQLKPENLAVSKTKGGIKITRGARQQYRLDIERANRRLKESREKYENLPVYLGQTLIGTSAKVYPGRYDDLAPITTNINKPKKKSSIEKILKTAQSAGRFGYDEDVMELYRKNYIYALIHEVGAFINVDNLVERLKKAALDKFANMYYSAPNVDMTFLYSLEEAMTKYAELDTTMQRYGI